MAGLVDELLHSKEPSVRWKVRRFVLGEAPDDRAMRALHDEIRRSPRVEALLSARDDRGRIPGGTYSKWRGAHWVLATLADLGYPAGDQSLEPLRDQVLDNWLRHQDYYVEFEAATLSAAYGRRGVAIMDGRHRRCASQQGNALRSLTELCLTNDRVGQLAERLLHWQWPDGGWNCDRNPEADTSSFMETLLPMRGLAAYGRAAGDDTAVAGARRAAEVFLERRLYKRRSDGTVIRPNFVKLHTPLYWHYDILGGLRGMVDAGTVRDDRCTDALDLLESKALPGGGWPAEAKYYRAPPAESANEHVDWGGTSAARRNDWVTVEALAVLRAAGRS